MAFAVLHVHLHHVAMRVVEGLDICHVDDFPPQKGFSRSHEQDDTPVRHHGHADHELLEDALQVIGFPSLPHPHLG